METNNQVNEAALIQLKEMQFQDDLKKLWMIILSFLFTHIADNIIC